MIETFRDWAQMRGRHRARFWREHGWMNLKRARAAQLLDRRHYPESYLHEFMSDLSQDDAALDGAQPESVPEPENKSRTLARSKSRGKS